MWNVFCKCWILCWSFMALHWVVAEIQTGCIPRHYPAQPHSPYFTAGEHWPLIPHYSMAFKTFSPCTALKLYMVSVNCAPLFLFLVFLFPLVLCFIVRQSEVYQNIWWLFCTWSKSLLLLSHKLFCLRATDSDGDTVQCILAHDCRFCWMTLP